MEFPAITVCNLNRVNCHNAFLALFNTKMALRNSTDQEEEEELRIEESLYTELVSGEVTDCLASVCLSIMEQTRQALNYSTMI